jgi:hypothetical protein
MLFVLNQYKTTDRLMCRTAGLDDMQSSVQQARKLLPDSADQADLTRVSGFLASERFQRLLRLHNKLVDVALNTPPPTVPPLPTASEKCRSVAEAIGSSATGNKYGRELLTLLADPNIRVSGVVSVLSLAAESVVITRFQ